MSEFVGIIESGGQRVVSTKYQTAIHRVETLLWNYKNNRFAKGDKAIIHGHSRSDLNEKSCEVVSELVSGGKFQVGVEGVSNPISVKRKNLKASQETIKGLQWSCSEAGVYSGLQILKSIDDNVATEVRNAHYCNAMMCATQALFHAENADAYGVRGVLNYVLEHYADAFLDLAKFYKARFEGHPEPAILSSLRRKFALGGRPEGSQHVASGKWECIDVDGPKARAFMGYCQGIMADAPYMFVYGGLLRKGTLCNDLWRLNLNTLVWQKVTTINSPSRSHCKIWLDGSILWLYGGKGSNETDCTDFYAFDMNQADEVVCTRETGDPALHRPIGGIGTLVARGNLLVDLVVVFPWWI